MARRRITVEDDAEILVHWRAGIEPLVEQVLAHGDDLLGQRLGHRGG